MDRFPALPTEIVDALNILGQWLAEDDFGPMPTITDMDIMVLAGNAVIPTLEGAFTLAQTANMPILISGGIGHSTTYPYSAIKCHPRYQHIRTAQRSEAEILAEIAVGFWGIDQNRVIIESQSTHCGTNAQFSLASLVERDIYPQRGVLIQDPTMQRRTQATFQRACQKANLPQVWRSLSPVKPQLACFPDGVGFVKPLAGLWQIERYISLICGELPRIMDTPQGYGPQGRDYMVHVDIPEKVAAAWDKVSNNKDIQDVLAARALG